MTTYNQILPDVGSVKSRQVSTAFLLGFAVSAYGVKGYDHDGDLGQVCSPAKEGNQSVMKPSRGVGWVT